jgi:hypothetical protein
MKNKHELTPTLAAVKVQTRKLDIQWNDTLALHDGRIAQAVEVLDEIVKALDKGRTVYIRRDQIKSVYPTNLKSIYAGKKV